MKNTHVKPGIFLIGILSAAVSISAFAGPSFSKGRHHPYRGVDKEVAQAKKKANAAKGDLESAIQFKRKAIAKTAFLCNSFAGLLGRPIDMSMLDGIKDPIGQRFLLILWQPDLVSSVSEALEPVLTELYKTYPHEAILTQMDEYLAASRQELVQLEAANALNQRFLDTGDNHSLEQADDIVQQLVGHLGSHDLKPIALKFYEILQENHDLVLERFTAMKISAGILEDIMSLSSAAEPKDESKED